MYFNNWLKQGVTKMWYMVYNTSFEIFYKMFLTVEVVQEYTLLILNYFFNYNPKINIIIKYLSSDIF